MPEPNYFDKRSGFWKKHWDMAQPYDEFLRSDPVNAPRWRKHMERIPVLSTEQRKKLQDYNRTLRILVYSAVWCGDCAMQGPILRRLAETTGDIELRFIDKDSSTELQDELRILGATRLPMVVFLTEDYWEVGREGDRLLPVYRALMAREMGRGELEGILTPKAVREHLSLWLDIFERAIIMTRLSPPLRKRHSD